VKVIKIEKCFECPYSYAIKKKDEDVWGYYCEHPDYLDDYGIGRIFMERKELSSEFPFPDICPLRDIHSSMIHVEG